jgi:transcriptional regulator with XRE-family HTH domain
MSLEVLADTIGMAKGNLSKIERGINPYTQDTIERLATALKVSPAELLSRQPGTPGELWQLVELANPEQRQQITAVAETLLRFQPYQSLDTLMAEIKARPPAPSRIGRVPGPRSGNSEPVKRYKQGKKNAADIE